MDSLTPHKLFRRAFLDAHGLRFPEGRRRLEDHVFVTRAYFLAEGISILADPVCYHHIQRDDTSNAGYARIDPPSYYGYVRETLDVIERHTEPGELRDRLLQRLLRQEALARVGDPDLLAQPEGYPAALVGAVRDLVEERFPPSVRSAMGTALRCRMALVRTGDLDRLAAQSRRLAAVRPECRPTVTRFVDGIFEVGVVVALSWEDRPLILEPDGDGWLLPAELAGLTDPELRRVEDPTAMVGHVLLRRRATQDEWYLPDQLTTRIEPGADGGRIVWSGTVRIDPASAAAGSALDAGIYDLFVRVAVLGLERDRRLGTTSEPGPRPLAVTGSGRIDRLYDTDLGNLSVSIGADASRLPERLAGIRPAVAADQVTLVGDLAWAEPPALTVTLERDGRSVQGRAGPQPDSATTWQLGLTAQRRVRLRPGRWQVTVAAPPARGKPPVSVVLAAPLVVGRGEYLRGLARSARRAPAAVAARLGR